MSRSVDYEWALVRLNNSPPANAIFSAWRSEPLGNGTSIAVEHHAASDLKKISEGTQGLDGGAHPGWLRTGLTFLAYSDPSVAPADVKPVCRSYVLPQYGASHFYSADPAECAATGVKFAGAWIEESDALFYIQVPDSDCSEFRGSWLQEGFGVPPNAPVMCAPAN